jgi:DNA-nicking Smr family endonuclease
MSRRRLSDEERALWKGVTRSIAPIRKRPVEVKDEAEPQALRPLAAPRPAPRPSPRTKSNSKPAAPKPAAPKSSTPTPIRPEPPPLAPLGRRFRQRLARGTREIDGRLDLHGMTQAQAHGALIGFLRGAQARGSKLVLVITGKGAGGGDPYSERGVLKRQVPLWLRLPECHSLIVGFEAAGIGHGGEGALYVSLRKLRGERADS